jgi:acetyl esterase/lipase
MFNRIILTVAIFYALQSVNASQASKRQEKIVSRIIARQDTNKDEKISRNEFKWREVVFDRLDSNEDGYLDKQELLASKQGSRVPKGVKKYSDIVYVNVDGKDLKLDIYVPEKSKNPPLLIWIHGGGWKMGSKSNINRAFFNLTKHGFVVASIDYSLLGLPGLLKIVYECKAAVRFLRANEQKYGFNAQNIGVGGSSAGGQLVLLLGTSGGISELEGKLGDNLKQSSSVQAVVDFFGPSDFIAMSKKKKNIRITTLAKMLSPVTYVNKNDPPLLIYHGSEDRTVPVEQGIIIDREYRKKKLESTLNIIKGAGHGFKRNELPNDKANTEMAAFFTKHLVKQ